MHQSKFRSQVGSPPRTEQVLPAIEVWSQRDYDLLNALCPTARMLSVTQIQRIWWPMQTRLRIVRRRLRQLAAAELIQRFIVNIAGIDGEPTLCDGMDERSMWDRPTPVRRHASCQAAQPTEVYVAAKKSANLFGASRWGLPSRERLDQEWLASEIYTLHRLESSDVICRDRYSTMAPMR